MVEYITYWIWWIGWRVSVTLACIFTIQNVVHAESGELIQTKPLLVAAICLVLVIRIWSSRSYPHSKGND